MCGGRAAGYGSTRGHPLIGERPNRAAPPLLSLHSLAQAMFRVLPTVPLTRAQRLLAWRHRQYMCEHSSVCSVHENEASWRGAVSTPTSVSTLLFTSCFLCVKNSPTNLAYLGANTEAHLSALTAPLPPRQAPLWQFLRALHWEPEPLPSLFAQAVCGDGRNGAEGESGGERGWGVEGHTKERARVEPPRQGELYSQITR